MRPIVVTGISTDVGKTIASAILVEALNADYWKPVQTGEKDSEIIKFLSDCFIHQENYHFEKPISPHAAGHIHSLELPKTDNLLVIEGCGGIMTPLTDSKLLIDVFSLWNPLWIVVTRHYLGSINHTIMTLEVLKNRSSDVLGLIINGNCNPSTEMMFKCPFLGRIEEETHFNRKIISQYAATWKILMAPIFKKYGILLDQQKRKSPQNSL